MPQRSTRSHTLGGVDYSVGPGISVEIDATGNAPDITATITGSDNSSVTLNSGVSARANSGYAVVVRRVGSRVTMAVNGEVKATATYGGELTRLEGWSLAMEDTMTQQARYPF